jgi:hypothetical protein
VLGFTTSTSGDGNSCLTSIRTLANVEQLDKVEVQAEVDEVAEIEKFVPLSRCVAQVWFKLLSVPDSIACAIMSALMRDWV